MSKMVDAGVALLPLLLPLLSSPLVLAILVIFGFVSTILVIATLFNFYIIGISFAAILIMFIVARMSSKRIPFPVLVFSVILGFFYWIYSVSSYISSVPFCQSILGFLCDALYVPALFLLIVYIIVFIIWLSIMKLFMLVIVQEVLQ